MPKTKDKFETVTEKGIKFSDGTTAPSSATVIRKGSERGKRFNADLERANRQLATDEDVATPALRRGAARQSAADWAGIEAETDAKMSKQGNFSKRISPQPLVSGDERSKYAKK
jgi:hypothetical protein